MKIKSLNNGRLQIDCDYRSLNSLLKELFKDKMGKIRCFCGYNHVKIVCNCGK